MLNLVNDFLWSKLLIAGLLGVGLWFSVGTRFVQFRYFGHMFSRLRSGMAHHEGQISSFQALVVSVGGRVGSGNIAGVAVAITFGGPGAVFWMWVVGLIGMAISLLECSLAQLYKQREPDGSFRGGPAYYMRRGLKRPWLATVFSILLLLTFGLAFNALQAHVVVSSLNASFGVPQWASGAALAVLLALSIFGGLRRIAQVAEVVVPVMAAAYLGISVFVIIINISELPSVFKLIFSSAFGLGPALGGGVGAAIALGVKRGLFSNEAGLGSAPNVAATALVDHPVEQGLVQALSVFIDTLLLCTCTATIILLSSAYTPGLESVDGLVLTQTALAEHVGDWGDEFVSLLLLLFGFSSILYNYYLGENSLNYFSEENQTLFNIFRALVLLLVMWGAVQDLGTVFSFGDFTMGLLGLVNLIAIAMMYKTGLKLVRDYDRQLLKGQRPRLEPEAFSECDVDGSAWANPKQSV